MPAPREPGWHRARRVALLSVAAVVALAGITNIAGQLLGWIRSPAASSAPAIADAAYAAVAVPFAVDYLSWDQERLPARQTALARAAAADTTVDGWGGTGRQWADSPTLLHIARRDPDRAIVTVRVRVTAYQPSGDPEPGPDANVPKPSSQPPPSPPDTQAPSTQEPSPRSQSSARAEPQQSAAPSTSTGVPDADAASGPLLGTPGRTALPSRWLNLAVPVRHTGERIVVTAAPAIVGSPPTNVPAPAAERNTASDTALADATRPAIRTLLSSYGRGDLTYARAAGTAFTGLDGAADLASITAWRALPAQDTAGRNAGTGDRAAGDVTAVWNLPGGASLTCSYRIELDRGAGRWYLADITVVTEAVTR